MTVAATVAASLSGLLAARPAVAAYVTKAAALKEPRHFRSTLRDLDRAADRDLDAVLITPKGDWLVVAGRVAAHSAGFAPGLLFDVKERLARNRRVSAGDCNELGSCVIVFDDGSASQSAPAHVPACFAKMLADHEKSHGAISDVEITGTSCVFLDTKGGATWSVALERELARALEDRKQAGRAIESLAIGFQHEWALVAGHDPMYVRAPPGLRGVLESRSRGTHVAQTIALGPGSDYLWYAARRLETRGPATGAGAAARLHAVEWELGEDRKTNLWQRMDQLGVTGVSVALIENGSSGPVVDVARGYGRRRADKDAPVLARTPFALASMSKMLGAIATASQLEDERGPRSIDAGTDLIYTPNMSSKGTLRRWQAIGENERSAFRQALPGDLGGDDPLAKLHIGITLDCLMVHRCRMASARDGSSTVRRGLWAANDARPTLDWLLGRQCTDDTCEPFGNPVWQVATDPGNFDYDSADYLLVQAYVEDRTGRSAHANLEERVFKPAGMVDSQSHIAIGAQFLEDAAWRHTNPGETDADMESSAWPFAGGVWSSSVDYAHAMIVLLDEGRAAGGTRVLKKESVRDHLLTAPKMFPHHWAWGVELDGGTSAGESTDRAFFHGGVQDGAQTYMCGNPTKNEGIVVLTNLGGEDARTLTDEIVAAYLSKAGWKSSLDCRRDRE